MRAVHVLFYHPQADDHWMNHLVVTFSPPYSHCDIQFEDGVASSIYQNETVYLQQKSFSRLNYHRESICVTEDEYARIRAFCEGAHANKVAFDLSGMLLSFSPVPKFKFSHKTFCSR